MRQPVPPSPKSKTHHMLSLRGRRRSLTLPSCTTVASCPPARGHRTLRDGRQPRPSRGSCRWWRSRRGAAETLHRRRIGPARSGQRLPSTSPARVLGPGHCSSVDNTRSQGRPWQKATVSGVKGQDEHPSVCDIKSHV